MTAPARQDALRRAIVAYTEALTVRNYSAWTVDRRKRSLTAFAAWAEERGLDRPEHITKPILERYVRHLHAYRKRDGQPLALRSQANQIAVLRVFFRWLVRRNHLAANPASELEAPRLGFRLPKAVLTHAEAEAVLAVPDLDTDAGVRDRALLEVLYSTGLRRSEVVALDRFDIDLGRAVVTVRAGKHQKDRVVPIGERAMDWVNRYQLDVRPGWVVDPAEEALFVSQYGRRLSPDALSARVKKYIEAADIGKTGSCHLFRHTMATLMLEGGADIRFVQQMLGHASISATQIYTHVSVVHLQKVHALTHPSAKRARAPRNLDSEPTDDA